MHVKPYGAAGQAKLAKYPDRIRQIQKLQEAIPNIQDLNLDETQDLQDRLKRYRKELSAYQVSMEAVVGCYNSLIEEAKADCDKMEIVIQKAPKDVDQGRLFSLTTSIVQTKQQLVFIEQQCESLNAQIESVKTAKAAIATALEQKQLANLAELLLALKQRDTEIHT